MRMSILALATASVWAQAPAAAPKTPAAKPARAAAPGPLTALKFPALRDPKIPDVVQFTLPNGMRVFLLENRELPVVSGFALVRTGNLFDPKDKVGLADVTGSVMRTGGTKAKTGDQLNEQLENIAASVESSIGETSGRVGFNCLKENTDEVMAVFKDVLTEPEFRQDKIDLEKTQQRSAIARRNDESDGIAAREFSSIVYGRGNPYGWQAEYATIDAIRRDDLIAFHRRYFFPKNTILAVQGDFAAAEMRAKIERLFGNWTAEQPPVPEFPKVDETPRAGIYLATKNDVNQTSFRLGHLGGTLRDADYPAIEVMASVLGGSPFTSRLGKAIRVQRGYAYQIGAAWSPQYLHPGTFFVVGGTKSENTVAAIRTIREEIDRFRDSEPTEEELRSAKDKILNTFVFAFDSPGKTLNRLVNYEYFGYPKDFIFQYKKAVEGVTRADVKRVARQYLKPENFSYVLVGKPSDFKTPLTELNLPVQPIDLTIPEPAAAKVEVTDATRARGQQLLARMVAAMGGEAKLAAVKDVSQSLDVQLSTPGASIKAKQKSLWIAPGVLRQESELPFGKIVAYFDGQGGWMKAPQGEMPLGGPVLRQVQEQLFHNLLGLARSGAMAGRQVNEVAPGTIEIAETAMNLSTRLVLDPATGLPQKQIYSGGQGQSVEEVYEAFTEAGGVKLPSKWSILQGGQKAAESTATETLVNSGLKSEDLAKKP